MTPIPVVFDLLHLRFKIGGSYLGVRVPDLLNDPVIPDHDELRAPINRDGRGVALNGRRAGIRRGHSGLRKLRIALLRRLQAASGHHEAKSEEKHAKRTTHVVKPLKLR